MYAAEPGACPLILGLGNPILGDDRIGLEVARALHARLPPGAAALCEAELGGMELMDRLEGWRKVALIDALEPGALEPGALVELELDDLATRYAPLTPHNAGLCHCLELGMRLGMQMPDDLVVFAIGVQDPYTFSEQLTAPLAQALPGLVEEIFERLFGPVGRWGCQ
ncbi:MAG: hydrogenase maturation protease [Deltaproteobacteria bacterium]|nr:hydrogenase maturation protease [Deltaproteobacteria bacterium]